ncbi:MAG TPA: glycosyltransferase [Solirubrobacteraceae bacterium]
MSAFGVVVVLHDSAGPLRALLASLAAHLPEPPQLVVVDTGSRDGGADLARAHGAEVLELPDNPGFGAANNAGVARIDRPVTVLLNPDCELLDADALPALAAHAAAAGRRPALHVPRLLNPDGSVQRSAHPLPGTAGALLPALVHPPLLPRAVRERAEPWRARTPRTVGWAIAACVAAPTATLRALGPFDPAQFLFYEDMDLCLRARAAGVPTVLHPDLRVRHLGGHATTPAYGGEPHALLAARRREVVGRTRGRTARRLDDAAQLLTFATRAAVRTALGRPATRERAQLAAQWAATPPA